VQESYLKHTLLAHPIPCDRTDRALDEVRLNTIEGYLIAGGAGICKLLVSSQSLKERCYNLINTVVAEA
jgi:hypothetical protein